MPDRPLEAGQWTTTREVLPVVGASGSCGATSLAVALATVLVPARVVECCSMSATGLAEAATAELGTDAHGWSSGAREQVTLSRATRVITGPETVPAPAVVDGPGVDVLDVGWQLEQVVAAGGWLAHQVQEAPTVVLAATASVPSLRRLENALVALPTSATAVIAVRSLGSRRLPAHVRAALGPRTQALLAQGAWVDVPHERDLADRGLSGSPLPRSLLSAAHQISRLTGAGSTTTKGYSS
ncbi:hypothetical protein ON003_00475 [Janibacter hoylei]|uniref:hypothetical protein n=1 Tax=Janibacter hoylei TaxID=364298 RepID=UPI00223799B7|nr:hypothetical protein [Janibacter hoylei]MCW4600258.1 hypothetical protein [Janibacter hoylei]